MSALGWGGRIQIQIALLFDITILRASAASPDVSHYVLARWRRAVLLLILLTVTLSDEDKDGSCKRNKYIRHQTVDSDGHPTAITVNIEKLRLYYNIP